MTFRRARVGASRQGVLGWLLLIAALAMPVWPLIRPDDLGVATEWANILAYVVGALGLALVLVDRGRQRPTESARRDIEAELISQAHDVAADRQVQLLGTDREEQTRADLAFAAREIHYRTACGDAIGTLSRVGDYYHALDPGRLVILGPPGAGKTVLALELVGQLTDESTRDGNNARPVPVMLSLASWTTDVEFDTWLINRLVEEFDVGRPAAEQLVKEHRVLPVLDGLDEMDAHSGQPPVRAAAAVAKLNSYRSGKLPPIVLTCRSDQYLRLGTRLDRATEIEIQPLNGTVIATYLRDQFLSTAEANAWKPVVDEITTEPTGVTARQLGNPWRLTLAVTVFRKGRQPAELLARPGEREDRYAARVTGTLLDGYVSAATSLHAGHYLNPEAVTRWLRAMSTQLKWQAERDIAGTDVVVHRWWSVGGYVWPRVLHAAVGLALAVPLVMALHADLVRPFRAHEPQALLAWLTLTIVIEIILVSAWVPWPEPSALQPRQLRTARGRRQMLIGLLAGGAVGAVATLAGGYATGAAIGGAVWIVIGVLLAKGGPRSVRPRDVLRSDMWFGMIALLIIGVAVGTSLSPLTGAAAGLAVGVVFSASWLRYLCACVTAALRRRHPLRQLKFFEWASQAGLLRISGVAYQFRHRELQDWLLGSASSEAPVRSENVASSR